jgi:5-methylcytosine-specific restriction endonuclease McrA
MCTADGRVSAASVADHVKPHRGDLFLFWNGELQSLCSACHNKWKKQLEMRGQTSQCDVHGAPKKN